MRTFPAVPSTWVKAWRRWAIDFTWCWRFLGRCNRASMQQSCGYWQEKTWENGTIKEKNWMDMLQSWGFNREWTALVCHFWGEQFWEMTKSRMHHRNVRWDIGKELYRWEGQGIEWIIHLTLHHPGDSSIGGRDKDWNRSHYKVCNEWENLSGRSTREMLAEVRR